VAVVLAVALLLLLLVALVGAATFAPWPFEAAAVLIGLCSGGLATIATSNLFLIVCAGCLPICALLTLKTIRQTLDAAAAARRAARPRRSRHSNPSAPAEEDHERRAA
jgi:hypothetical protein